MYTDPETGQSYGIPEWLVTEPLKYSKGEGYGAMYYLIDEVWDEEWDELLSGVVLQENKMNKLEIYTRIEEEKLAVKNHQDRIVELEVALKPKNKPWDFGLSQSNFLTSNQGKGWTNVFVPSQLGCSTYENVKVLGNLKNIVENEGPIVIGLSVEEAKHIQRVWSTIGSDAHNHVVTGVAAALERYNNG